MGDNPNDVVVGELFTLKCQWLEKSNSPTQKTGLI
jgi:hypothetical protein